jgi:hypothetical protein
VNRGIIMTAVLLDSLSFGGEIGAETTARSLIACGLQVYVMGRGSKITSALDSRLPYLHGYPDFLSPLAGEEKV